jgi:hypothetical protein
LGSFRKKEGTANDEAFEVAYSVRRFLVDELDNGSRSGSPLDITSVSSVPWRAAYEIEHRGSPFWSMNSTPAG